MELKILSWNIWIDCRFDEVKSYLRDADADIIGLQEVKGDDADRDIVSFLTDLGYEHVFAPVQKVWADKTFNDGPAVFSRHKIVSSKIHVLSEDKRREAVQADIKIGDMILHAFSTHLIHTHQESSEVQESQADHLLGVLTAERTIVMGDFNATPESATIRKMKAVLTDSDPESQPTWSMHPEGCTVCNPQHLDTRLDYIFTSPDLKTRSFEVGKSSASDHLPVSVILSL